MNHKEEIYLYLHLGNELSVKIKDIIGIFDMDTSTMKNDTKDFLEKLQEQGKLVTVSDFSLPKSVVVVKNKKYERAYLSPMSTSTLQKRLKIT